MTEKLRVRNQVVMTAAQMGTKWANYLAVKLVPTKVEWQGYILVEVKAVWLEFQMGESKVADLAACSALPQAFPKVGNWVQSLAELLAAKWAQKLVEQLVVWKVILSVVLLVVLLALMKESDLAVMTDELMVVMKE